MLDVCDEFDCTIEYAQSRGVDCGRDFTKKPCIFHGEHIILNVTKNTETDQESSQMANDELLEGGYERA